jgi:hypothetical protein
MRERTKSMAGVAREALAVGESALPRFARKCSRRGTLPQLLACLAACKFLGRDYWGRVVGAAGGGAPVGLGPGPRLPYA